MHEVRDHEAHVTCELVPGALLVDDVTDELVAAAGQDVQHRHCHDAERQARPHLVRPVAQVEDDGAGGQLGEAEEGLVVPLFVEVVVPGVKVHPPAVVVRVYVRTYQHQHREAGPPGQHHLT